MTIVEWLRIVLAPLVTAALLSFAPAALADEPGEEAMSEAAAAEPAQEPVVAPGGIEEITVTARKREESVQDIPIAITAFSGTDLENINIDDVMDLQFNVPNVSFTKTNFSGSGSLAIRGIGRSVTAASGDAGTGTHVNGIPITAARIFETEFFDAERVEVLRGPQGTLYGRNSSAGSLNMISRKPTDEYSGYLEGQYGEFEHYKLKGALNIPLGERLALRVAGMYLDRDGYTRNQHTGNWIDDRELWGVRATLAADLGENTDATLTMSWFDEDDNRARLQKQSCKRTGAPFPVNLGCSSTELGSDAIDGKATLPYQWGFLMSFNPTTGGFQPTPAGGGPACPECLPYFSSVDAAGNPLDPYANSVNPKDERRVNTLFDPEYKADEYVAGLEVNHTWQDLTFTGVIGFHDAHVWSQQDYLVSVPSEPFGWGPQFFEFPGSSKNRSGFYDREFVFDQSNSHVRQWTYEFRVATDFEGPVNFTGGMLFLDYEWDGDYYVWGAGLEAFDRSILLAPPSEVLPKGFSLYDLEPRGSYFLAETHPYELDTRAAFGELYYDLTQSTRVTLGARLTHDRKQVTHRSGNLIVGALSPFEQDANRWTRWTTKISIDQRVEIPTGDALLYATFSSGYKAGGFNNPVQEGIERQFAPIFDPELIDSYEVGVKSSLFGNRVIFNLFRVSSMTTRTFQVSKIVSRTSINENIDAEIWGAELETVFQPFAGLRLEAGASYLDTDIQSARSIDTRDPSGGVPGTLAVKDFVNGFGTGANSVITDVYQAWGTACLRTPWQVLQRAASWSRASRRTSRATSFRTHQSGA